MTENNLPPNGRPPVVIGDHRPVLLREVLAALRPTIGETMVDATVGLAGHSTEILRAIGPAGRLIGFDFDPASLDLSRQRLVEVGQNFVLEHCNFAGLVNRLARHGIITVDGLLADLGVSSPQLDLPIRGFSYIRPGPLDMRMDPTRGLTAEAQLEKMSVEELAIALRDLGDEPFAGPIAVAIKAGLSAGTLRTTTDLQQLVRAIANPKNRRSLSPRDGNLASVARVFQTIRILVNRELANLECLLRILPGLLKPNGRAVIISFHSGEDRLVKQAFRQGYRDGVYSQISAEPIRANYEERQANPRSRSAKLRFAVRAPDDENVTKNQLLYDDLNP